MTKTCQMVWLFGCSEETYPDVEAAWGAALRELVLVELDSDQCTNPSYDGVSRKLIERDKVVLFGS